MRPYLAVYTTYDVRRNQDCINPNGQRNAVMTLAVNDDPTAHRFWYAKVLGIYHAEIFQRGQSSLAPTRVDFLFVRWFGMDSDPHVLSGGWGNRRLDRIGYLPTSEGEAFGFIDPAAVIRGCHLIPAFAEEYTTELSGNTSHRDNEQEGDWQIYYVMRYVLHWYLDFLIY